MQELQQRLRPSLRGPVSKDLAPVIVFLSFSGYRHGRLAVHERAWVDETTGIEYDIDSERRSYPSKPHLVKEDGRVKQIVARSPREARKIVASLKAKGLIKKVIEKIEIREGLSPPLRNVRITVGPQMRQLAVKMCVAVGQLVVPDIVLIDEPCREFLLDQSPESSPVRQAHLQYADLDALRPPLAHAVYIEGHPGSRRCFGVVQLFGGAFQFYAPLSRAYTGRKFAALGVLDITTPLESFEEIEPLELPEAPHFIGHDELQRFLAEWGTDFNAQVQAAFGRNTIVLGTTATQVVSGVRVTLPLLWVEHQIDFQLMMELVPDRELDKDVSLPNDPRKWVFSPDFGVTRLAVFDSFAQRWNADALNRTLEEEHLYVPDDIVPGTRLLMAEHFWCPVKSMSMRYRVHRRAWLGSVDLPSSSGELDQWQHTLQTKVRLTVDDIPASRDPSWPAIADPDSYEATAENVLVVEKWGIDPSSFRFTEFRAEREV